MVGWFEYWFGHDLYMKLARTLYGGRRPADEDAHRWPIRPKTEEEIRADEKRFDEEARRLDAEDAARPRH